MLVDLRCGQRERLPRPHDGDLERKGFAPAPTELAQTISQHLYLGLRAH